MLQAVHLCIIYFISSNKFSSPPFHHSPITAHSVRFVPNQCAVGGVLHPQHTHTSSNSSTIAADSSNGVTKIPDAVDTVVCAPDDGPWYHPKHVEQFPDKINCVTLHLVGYILEYLTDNFSTQNYTINP